MPAKATIREVSRISPQMVDFDGARPRLRDALAVARRHPSVATHLAAALEYRRAGILDRAYDHLEAAADLDAQNAAVNDALARNWRDWRLPGVGLSYAYRAVYAEPRSATARHTLGTLLHALGRRTDAEASYRETLALDPSAWYAWQNLCALALDAGRTQDAVGYCKQATRVRQEHSKARRP